MIDLKTYTLLHTAVSLVALAAGIVLLLAFARGRPAPRLAGFTLVTLALTSLGGFGFPFVKFLPSHAVGVLSLIVLAVAVWARRGRPLAYAASLAVAVWFDAFVAVVQAFLKVPALAAIAPTQQSPGFLLAQALTLLAFVALGVAAARGLRRRTPAAPPLAPGMA